MGSKRVAALELEVERLQNYLDIVWIWMISQRARSNVERGMDFGAALEAAEADARRMIKPKFQEEYE